jgi:hypothetical protein
MPYEGPFESQEEEDLAYKRSKHIKDRIRKDEKEEADRLAAEEEKKKKKKSNLLPVVD